MDSRYPSTLSLLSNNMAYRRYVVLSSKIYSLICISHLPFIVSIDVHYINDAYVAIMVNCNSVQYVMLFQLVC